jgi:predicted nucleic acid-binding protein
MAIEASTIIPRFSAHTVVSRLKTRSTLVKSLHKYSKILEVIPTLNIKIISATFDDILNSIKVKEAYGLLTNDSLIVALMQKQNIKLLATNDKDFAKIKFLHIWKPSHSNN